MAENQVVIISVGGSLIVPDEIDVNFLKNFRKLILNQKDKKFIIICGGGKLARRYQEAANSVLKLDKEKTDWIGIHSTRLNANLMRIIFSDIINEEIISDPTQKIEFNKLLIAAGWKPGCSTDNDAVILAKTFGVKKIINLSNIDYVYDKDPKKFKDAKKIENISWKELRKLLPKEWSPGLNAPFDPVAAKESENLGIEVAIMNGKDIKNLENYLSNKKFIGTIIN